jgi:hypothetical protein
VQLVGAEAPAGEQGRVGLAEDLRGGAARVLVEKVTRRGLLCEQRFHLPPQRLVAGARVSEKGFAIALAAQQRRVNNLLDLPPPFRRHGSERRVISSTPRPS